MNLAEIPRKTDLAGDLPMFEKFDESAIKVIMLAQEESRRLGHNYVGSEQILLGVLGEGVGVGAKTLRSNGVNLKDARFEVEKIIGRGGGFVAVEIPFTPRAKRILESSLAESKSMSHSFINSSHLLLGLLKEEEGTAVEVLKTLGADPGSLRSEIWQQLDSAGPTSYSSSVTENPRKAQNTKTINDFGIDLTELARKGAMGPCVERENELDSLMRILNRRSKRAALLVGEPGVGRSSIACGLAMRIVNRTAPESFLRQRVVWLDLGFILAHRDAIITLQNCFLEAEYNNVLFVFDELQEFFQPKLQDSTDAARHLNWFLRNRNLCCIGMVSAEGYGQISKLHSPLHRFFHPLFISPPSIEQAIEMLNTHVPLLEHHHRVEISPEAVEQAVHLSESCIREGVLPTKALTVLEETCTVLRQRRGNLLPSNQKHQAQLERISVAGEDVAEVVRNWYGVLGASGAASAN